MKIVVLLMSLVSAVYLQHDKQLPAIIIPGSFEDCSEPRVVELTQAISKFITPRDVNGYYGVCLDIGVWNSIALGFHKQAEMICQKFLDDKYLQELTKDGFNLIGLSQGGLLARYIVEKCPRQHKVHKLITFGTPHTGVSAFPHCFAGTICAYLNSFIGNHIYSETVQESLGAAGYFVDPLHYETYLNSSRFLPDLNNQRDFDPQAKENMEELQGLMLVMFREDAWIFPKESAWFAQLVPPSFPTDQWDMLNFDETELYEEDLIGLKILVEKGKIDFVEFEGDHMTITDMQLEQIIVPFLLK